MPVESATLRALIDAEAPLRPARAVQIALQLLEALDDMHEHGRVHGDVRAERVLLQNGQVSLLAAESSHRVQSDVHGAASILYELLTRAEPTSDKPMSRCTPAILPARLDGVVERALGPPDGFTAAQFAQELRVCLVETLTEGARRLRSPQRF